MADRSRERPLKQGERLVVLAVSLVLLCFACYGVSGSFLPGFDSSGLWFYSAAFGLLLGDLVVEPWYSRPADSVTNASAVLLATLTASNSGLEVSQDAFSTGRAVCLGFALAVLAVGLAAMISRRDPPALPSRFHRGTYVLATTFGRASVIFWLFFVATSTAAYASEPEKLLVLYLTGGLLLGAQPVRVATERLIRVTRTDNNDRGAFLIVDRIGEPHTALLRAGAGALPRVGAEIEREGMKIGVVVAAGELDANRAVEASVVAGVEIKEGDRLEFKINPDESRIVGSVGRETSLDRLYVSGSGTRFDEVGLVEGGLIEVEVRDRPVLFQVVDAEIVGGTPEGSSVSKKVRVLGRKLGVWHEGAFDPADWIPQPGAIAKRADASRTKGIDTSFVGRVPETDYGAAYDANLGATHNTAVLGILGSGKTTLAAELIWRTMALESRPKVIVIDITNEYAKKFEGVFSPDNQKAIEKELNDDIAVRLNAKDYSGDAAGNRALFADSLHGVLKRFFESELPMLILNPASLEVTQDDGGFPDSRGQAKRTVNLTPAEVTAIISEQVLDHLRGEFSTKLRACLVLEEAHSLAPEWNSTANDGEKQASTATARALMQGRKFGFGSIVVTQRTANVTKSILNQCNSVFALRVYDQTGTEFLGNFIGNDYARLLANLKDRHAVFFGKASSCKSPLLLELNDTHELDTWRAEVVQNLNLKTEPASETMDQGAVVSAVSQSPPVASSNGEIVEVEGAADAPELLS